MIITLHHNYVVCMYQIIASRRSACGLITYNAKGIFWGFVNHNLVCISCKIVYTCVCSVATYVIPYYVYVKFWSPMGCLYGLHALVMYGNLILQTFHLLNSVN